MYQYQQNYPFALFQYPPHEEFKMRARLVELLDTLRSKGWIILNVDLFATLIDYLDEQEDGELIEALIQEEKLQYSVNKNDHSMPLSVLQNSLDIFLKDPQEYPKVVFDKIIKKQNTVIQRKRLFFYQELGACIRFTELHPSYAI